MYDVFISYRRDTGKDLASSFVQLIQSHGFLPYFDIADHTTGEFRDNIKHAISNSRLFLLIITEGSIKRFQNPEDISRLEVEYAFECGLKIMPISAIGEKVFEEINMHKDSLPESIKNLTNHNVEFYKHELQRSTYHAIIQNLESVRKDYFSKIKFSYDSLSKECNPFDFIKNVEQYELTIDAEKCLYTGLLKFNRPFGKGTIYHIESGTYYEITFDLSHPYYGSGKHFKEDKLIYEGDFNCLKYNGQGVLFEKDGRYVGGFLNGKKYGKGTKYFEDNKVFNGYWNGNEFQGPFIKFPDNQTRYYGEVRDSQPSGYGELIKENKILNGLFRNGVFLEGVAQLKHKIIKGDFTYNRNMSVFDENQNLIYEGNLKDLEIHGDGKYYIDGKSLSNFNIINELLNTFKFHIFDFENINLVLHASFINKNEIDINHEIKITRKDNGIKLVSGYIKENRSLFVYVNGEPIEINNSANHNTKSKLIISEDFRVID
ncbi:hypothetical protein SAMN05880501_1242 [Ureibacillus xyleni]|uniref:TIR domain-containing protein n=1 Tax=Ureibacillus xyleni TaxID=614648 RepID=A0A285TY70_9BACL|nr:TIR domain-containing protein [Ureibacillus xyleni]SOC27575.1 hypothetical protein SAMN05880501_1242 [Ureibacillus xyleni]